MPEVILNGRQKPCLTRWNAWSADNYIEDWNSALHSCALSTSYIDFYTDYASATILGNDENLRQLLKGSAADREMNTK